MSVTDVCVTKVGGRHILAGRSNGIQTEETKNQVHVHVADTVWSTFTGFLRECSGQWKATYLPIGEGRELRRVLVLRQLPAQGKSAELARRILGGDSFTHGLLSEGLFDNDGNILGGRGTVRIFRATGNPLNAIAYQVLKLAGWSEAELTVNYKFSETLLIHARDVHRALDIRTSRVTAFFPNGLPKSSW